MRLPLWLREVGWILAMLLLLAFVLLLSAAATKFIYIDF